MHTTHGRRKYPLVSIIILSGAGDFAMTRLCLEALERHSAYTPLEILVVDNGSPQEKWRKLKRIAGGVPRPTTVLIRHSTNLGYARANNEAAKLANGEILVFLNNDVIVTEGWLRPLVDFMGREARVVACQPKLRSAVAKAYFDYAGGAGGFIDFLGYPFTRGRVFNRIERDIGQYDTVAEVTWASGSCLVIQKAVFWQAGGFDDYFFAYMEEIDLALRIRELGYRIFCVPESLVYHYGAYTSNRNLPHKIYLNHRNNLYLVAKHYSLWPYLPIIALRVVLDLFSMLHYLLELKFSFIGSVVRAYLSLIGSLPELVRRKVVTLSGRNLLRNHTVFRRSIVLDYFLLGKKNYDRIVGRGGGTPRSYKRYVEVTYLDQPRSPIPPLPTKM